MPRRPSSMAETRPLGPPPTISTSTSRRVTVTDVLLRTSLLPGVLLNGDESDAELEKTKWYVDLVRRGCDRSVIRSGSTINSSFTANAASEPR